MSDLRDRFGAPTGADMAAFSSSVAEDMRLAVHDVTGSIAHAIMLGECGVVSQAEADAMVGGLERIRDELRDGSWQPSAEDEDIHMAVEARLVERIGEAGRKLHTARSRNDQVATDVRLWMKDAIDELDTALASLLGSLLDRVVSDGRAVIPGYTHLQRGQPIRLGHQWLAHAWALARDRERLRDARARVDRSPLGACAMAGTPHPIDRGRTAEILGFDGVVPNAMDAVAARDHHQEVAAACAICAGHLSRMAEELVLWSSSEFALVRLDDAYATGSSIMPQKRNPDAAELVRGKTARVPAALATLLALTRGLPMAYNRDLQEDKRPLYDAADTTRDCVRILDGVVRTLTVRAGRFEDTLRGDFSLATEIADHLVGAGVPFRDAHGVAARIVKWCEDTGGKLDLLTPELAASFHPALAGELDELLDPAAAAERRTSVGGTAWREIERQVEALRATLPR